MRFRTLLFRYLAVGFILLATVVVAGPTAPPGRADPDPWDYQREQVDVQGSGILNAYACTAVRATAWMAKSSIERQRDMLRLSLFDVLIGPGAARSLGGWRVEHAEPLEAGTKAALLGLIAYGVVRRPAWRHLTVAALLLLVATLVVTRLQTTVEAAHRPGLLVPNAMLGVVTHVAPDGAAGDQLGAEPTQRRLLTRYWKSYVAYPLSRMQTGTAVLADAPPDRKAGVLRAAHERLGGETTGRWPPRAASGLHRHLGPRLRDAVRGRAGALAMVAACAQTVLFLLCLAGCSPCPWPSPAPPAARPGPLLAGPAAGHDRRAGRGVAALLHGRAGGRDPARLRRVRGPAAGRVDLAGAGRRPDRALAHPPPAPGSGPPPSGPVPAAKAPRS